MLNNLKNKKILFLEDNLTFAQNTIKLLELYFKEVIHSVSIKGAFAIFQNENIDMVISDLKVEDGIALNFIEDVRKIDSKIPIVVLSAHKDEDLLLKAIPLGLTTYAIKPLNFTQFEEILSLCSSQFDKITNSNIHLKDNIFYDMNKKIILKDNMEITLNQREVLFIELILKNKNSIVSKEQIEERIWENNEMSDSALKNLILRLRKKIDKSIFTTVPKLGYKL